MTNRLDELNEKFAGVKEQLRKPSKLTVYAILAGLLILAIIIGAIVNSSIKGKNKTAGDTFTQNDIAFSSKFDGVNYGDLITFDRENALSGHLIKRIVGMPGDTVDINDNGQVFVNGQQYQTDKQYFKKDIPLPLTVPEGKLFVLGDTGDSSADSRHSFVGFVDINSIKGKAK